MRRLEPVTLCPSAMPLGASPAYTRDKGEQAAPEPERG